MAVAPFPTQAFIHHETHPYNRLGPRMYRWASNSEWCVLCVLYRNNVSCNRRNETLRALSVVGGWVETERNQSQEIMANKYYYVDKYVWGRAHSSQRVHVDIKSGKLLLNSTGVPSTTVVKEEHSLKVTVIEIETDNRSSIPGAEMELMDELEVLCGRHHTHTLCIVATVTPPVLVVWYWLSSSSGCSLSNPPPPWVSTPLPLHVLGRTRTNLL